MCVYVWARKHWLTPTIWTLCFKTPIWEKLGAFFYFHGSDFALDREQRHCRGGRWRAGGQQVMCLPPECLHMLCVGGFMAMPPLARIPHRWGSEGTVVPCTAGQLVLLDPATHQLKRRVAHTHAHSILGTVLYTFLARQAAQMPMQDNPVGIDASLGVLKINSGEEQAVNMRKTMKQRTENSPFSIVFTDNPRCQVWHCA